MHDDDAFVRLKEEILECHPFVLLIPDEIEKKRNSMANKKTQSSWQQAQDIFDVLPEQNHDKYTVAQCEYAEMNDEKNDQKGFLCSRYRFTS